MKVDDYIKNKRRGIVKLSRKGSMLFYGFLLLLLLFFVIMYIKYKMTYGG